MTIHDISEEQWIEVKKLCAQIHASGQFNHDMGKCMVYSFLVWISNQPELDFGVEMEEGKSAVLH